MVHRTVDIAEIHAANCHSAGTFCLQSLPSWLQHGKILNTAGLGGVLLSKHPRRSYSNNSPRRSTMTVWLIGVGRVRP